MIDISVIVPFHRNLAMLRRVLAPFRSRPTSVEVVIAADGPTDEDWQALATEFGATGVQLPLRSGPAAARNRAAAVARGRILFFVDGDVVAASDAVDQVAAFLHGNPDVAAVFGTYDDAPDALQFVSQYRNLSHRYVHCTTAREARTFWAGLGAVRADAFRSVGGFDESFARPCVEDIELGYRLTAAGHRIVVEPAIEGKHLKRWTFVSVLRSDVFDRGIPWTQLLLRVKSTQTDLNLTPRLRLSVVASYLFVALVALAVKWPVAGVLAIVALVSLLVLNWEYYRHFAAIRGRWFAARVVPMHLVHHLGNGVSFFIGTVLFHLQRLLRRTLPGGLPISSADRRPGGRAAFGA